MFCCVLPLCPYESTRLKDAVRNERNVFRMAQASAKKASGKGLRKSLRTGSRLS
jgi:hypothetical protein